MKKALTLITVFVLLSLPTLVNAQCVGGIVTAIRDTICEGTPGTLTISGNSTGSIQWQSSVDNINFTNAFADTLTTYKTQPLLQTTWYRVVTGGSCISDTLRLYVPPPITVYFSSSSSNNNNGISFNSDSSYGKIRSYHWDFGDGQTSDVQNPTHTYSKDTTYYVCLTLYDGSNCSYTFCRYTQSQGSGLNIIGMPTDATCGNSDGSVAITVSGGVTPYSYLWSTGATTQNLNNVTAGTYAVTVTDYDGLTGSVSESVSNSNGPVIYGVQTNEQNATDSTGSISVSISGGTSPYTLHWSNGATVDTLVNLAPGTYTLTVSDAGGCLALQSYIIYPAFYNSFYVYVYGTQPNCSNNGSLVAGVYGGSPPYSYKWSTGGRDQIISGLDAGNYSVTVTDAGSEVQVGYYYLQTSCYNIIQGRVFNDANNNCIFDAGDSPESWETVIASNGTDDYYGFTDYNGLFYIEIPVSGAFQITTYSYYAGACGNTTLCGNSSNRITFGSVGDTATVNLGFVGSPGYDLTIHPGWTSAKPGFQKEYWVMPYNQASANTFTGTATVVFKYDSALEYQYSYNPQPIHNATTHTLTWTVNNVPYPSFDWNNVRFENFFTVPASLPLGYQLQSSFYITPTSGDCDSSNNLLTFSEDVTGSHDPNEKEVSPAGDITPNDSVLTYTIHFQNDGTDTTSFIIVRDTLSPNLNPASVQTVASSHPYSQFYVSGKGVLTWVFNPILLVDSATNLSASKGFVSFRIKKKADLPLNTVISNKASIFFDYNSAVVTNTVTNAITTGIKTVAGNSGVSVNVYPNPFSESSTFEVTGLQGSYSFTLSNVLGQQVQQLNGINSSKFDINRSNLNAGIYFYSIVANGKTVANGKVVVQ